MEEYRLMQIKAEERKNVFDFFKRWLLGFVIDVVRIIREVIRETIKTWEKNRRCKGKECSEGVRIKEGYVIN